MKVGLFVTCLVDAMRPEIGFSALTLLEAAGCEVFVPESQTCCGQPGYSSGDRKAARSLAEKFIEEFEGFEYVVIPSGSCGGNVKTHYADLFRDDPAWLARVERLAPRVYELTDFLYSVAKLTPGSLPGQGGLAGAVTYHDSCCGLRELGVQRQPRALLEQAGVEVKEMRDSRQCCGFGGTFALKYGDISSAIVDEKCRNIHDTGARAVVLGDLGCMLNIEGRLRRTGDHDTRVLHVAQVLAGDLGGNDGTAGKGGR
ncbi:(Fe-S)-binding protein [Noviherbaspirillum galbum]|uniref:(Fe-S)-binding protein n=1 Tax=Noviherbaspirillum galbum TaxID=2709383 RepID=A0A6B3SMG4_9BURK|nr:(Fe-S)-binding protein [Noviherbaspirillum galbum]NEX61971.1 (Fe-S)-binding protein [Noviherbaspirillum galbum]